MIKRILVALSGSPYTESAIAQAIELARVHQASLTGVTVVNTRAAGEVGSFPAGTGHLALELKQHRLDLIRQNVDESIALFEEISGRERLPYQVVREEGDPFERLIELWYYHDLTVVGLRGFFAYGVLDEPDDWLKTLLKAGARSILAVAEAPRPLRKVLLAYNGSVEAARAMKSFAQKQLVPQAQLRIVCYRARHSTADAVLANAAAYCRDHGFDVETANPSGRARDHLLDEARTWGADLVVLGSTPRQRPRFVLSDTALRAIRDADLPLFLTQ